MKTTTMISEKTLFDAVKNIYTLEDLFTDTLNRQKFEYIQNSNDLTINNISGTNYDGFWAWTSGGISISIEVNVNFLLGNGFYNSETKIGKDIQKYENIAHNHAIKEIGERTEKNENEYYEIVDSYLDDCNITIDIDYFLLDNGDVSFKEGINNNKPYITNRISVDNVIVKTEHLTTKTITKSNLNKFINRTLITNAKFINELL